jgi:hypothetical protein
MKPSTLLCSSLVALVLVSFALPAHSQFVTIARKIKSMRTSEADIATVLLEAGTSGVYRAILDTLTSNKKFEISSRDNTKRFVEFTFQKQKVSMQVDSLEKNLTQITVASPHSEKSAKQTTDLAVEALMRAGRMVGIKCSADKQ